MEGGMAGQFPRGRKLPEMPSFDTALGLLLFSIFINCLKNHMSCDGIELAATLIWASKELKLL